MCRNRYGVPTLSAAILKYPKPGTQKSNGSTVWSTLVQMRSQGVLTKWTASPLGTRPWSVFSRPLCIPSASGIGVLRFKRPWSLGPDMFESPKRSRQATKQKTKHNTNKSIIPRRLERRASGPAIDSLRLLCQGWCAMLGPIY